VVAYKRLGNETLPDVDVLLRNAYLQAKTGDPAFFSNNAFAHYRITPPDLPDWLADRGKTWFFLTDTGKADLSQMRAHLSELLPSSSATKPFLDGMIEKLQAKMEAFERVIVSAKDENRIEWVA
jgi:hypothetical protein